MKLADNDGTFTYSRILTIKDSIGNLILSVYPNPAVTTAVLKFNNSKAGKYCITITNMNGITVCYHDKIAIHGVNIAQINLQGYAAGVYLITLDGVTGRRLLKLVKEKN